MENKFTERPDHSHYGACSSRLREIDDKSRFRSKYTIISSAAACMFGVGCKNKRIFSPYRFVYRTKRIYGT